MYRRGDSSRSVLEETDDARRRDSCSSTESNRCVAAEWYADGVDGALAAVSPFHTPYEDTDAEPECGRDDGAWPGEDGA